VFPFSCQTTPEVLTIAVMRQVLRRTGIAALTASVLVSALSAQNPGTSGRGVAPAKGLIVGRVLDAVSNVPLASVIVSLAGAQLTSSIRVLTDAKGQFLFRNVPAGSFTLRATIGGFGQTSGFSWAGLGPQVGPYLAGGYGQRRPGGLLQPIDVADGEQVADVVITLWQGGSIDGTIRDEAGEPLVDVFVAAARRSSDGRLLNGPSVRTDDRGAYHLGTLVPGDYVIVVPQLQGAMPSATSDALATTTNRPLSAKLANSAAPTFTGGIAVGGSLIGADLPTNTSGNALSPVPQGDALHVYQTTYAPSTTALSAATTVRVSPGEAHSGVDVSMRPVRAVAVSGTLVDDLGPVQNFGVRLFTRGDDTGAIPFDVSFTSTDARGRFTFPLVPAGHYRVVAMRYATTHFGPDVVLPPPGPPRAADRFGASAQQEITVGDQDVSEIALQLRLGVEASGRVVFRGSGRRPSADVMRRLLVFVSPFEPHSRSFAPRPLSVNPDAKDGFGIQNISPGRYVLTVNDAASASLLSVSVGGKPVTERPLVIGTADLDDIVIELTDRPAEVVGTVRSRAGLPDADAGVVLFPTDRRRWPEVRVGARMFRSGRTSRTGAFSLRPVLPGEYFVAAVADDATSEFPEPRFLEALAGVATTVRVGVGEKLNATLTTVDAPVLRSLAVLKPSVPLESEPTRHGPFVEEATGTTDAQARATVVGLTGVVTTDETPARPLRHAIVTATAAEMPGARQAVTDDEGRFAFSNLPPGWHSLVVEKPGYVKTFYGGTRPGGTQGTPVAVLAGQPAPNLTIRVPRGAVITGTVRDQFGTPVSTAQVSVKQAVVVSGRRGMSDVPNLRVPVATTDDQGRYRIYGLPPGEYAVFCSLPAINYSGVQETNSADVDAVLRELRAGRTAPITSAGAPRQVSMAGGYMPGVPDADSALLITLAIGEERAGADILIGPLRALSVSGTSLGPGGTPMRNIMVAVVNTATGTRIGSGGVIMPGADGRFVLSALPPGRYTLMGRAAENGAGEGDAMPYFAETEFVLTDENISGIVLQFERGVTVTGRIVGPPDAASGAVANVRLGATPVDSFASLVPTRVIATTRKDGTFVFDGVGPGKWRVTGASLPAGWSLRSAVLGGRDTLDVPFEVRLGQPIAGLTVTMTNQPTELTGTVLDAAGRPTSEFSMLAFSVERALWTTAPRRVSGAARLSSDGRYRISGLPPGEYYLAVIADVPPGQLDDPSFLESLTPKAVKVVLHESERKVQDYRVR
jgi:protocatechuate 3,4-dioxygenase beta subunit